MLLLLLAYLGGALTLLSPCILPVLPFVFARADRPFLRSTLPLLLGMALTFTVVASLAAVGSQWVAQANQVGRWIALLLMALFAVALLWPRLADHLLAPTRIYVKSVLDLIASVDVHAIAHLTGGGFWENIPRVLPDNTQAVIDESSWQWPAVFDWLQSAGNVSRHEMYRTFNRGVGMVIALPAQEVDKAIELMNAKGEKAWKIGMIKASDSSERVVIE